MADMSDNNGESILLVVYLLFFMCVKSNTANLFSNIISGSVISAVKDMYIILLAGIFLNTSIDIY